MSGIYPSVSEVAALLGNPARANIVMALMDGRALTASDLARAAGVSAQTTSEHLASLREANLLALTKQGRHHYFRLGSPKVAGMIESIMAVAADGLPRYRPKWKADEALRMARTCYDHIAGRLGVGLTDALTGHRRLFLSEDGGVLTRAGEHLLTDFGLRLEEIKRDRRVFCRPCLDWSERRPHLAGALGSAIAKRCFELRWVDRRPDSRALEISASGAQGFKDIFGLTLSPDI